MRINPQEVIRSDVSALMHDVQKRYPDLRPIMDNGHPVIRGSFPIADNGEAIDRFIIEIRFPDGITKPPRIWEIGGRIPRIKDRHVFPDSGCICAEVPELTLLRGYSFMTYLDGPVRNYFIGQALVEQGHAWPFDEWDHGKPGLLQAYGEMLGGVSGEQKIKSYLICLGHKKIKHYWPCPCLSGKQIFECHEKDLRILHARIPHKIASLALNHLKIYA